MLHLYLEVKAAKGELSRGEKLPSVRAFASDIGVNLHTVNKAYHQLRDEGYILIHRQRGVVVHPDGTPKADDAYMSELKQSLHPLIAASICRAVSSQEFQQVCADIYQEFGQGKDDICFNYRNDCTDGHRFYPLRTIPF